MRIIAGPCQHESLEMSLEIATYCKYVCEQYDIDYYFKASYDKANRSKGSSPRGQGIVQTMNDFWVMKNMIRELKTLTDDVIKSIVKLSGKSHVILFGINSILVSLSICDNCFH